jgi:hypothetical protein
VRELCGTSVEAGAQQLVGAIDAERLDLDAYFAFGGSMMGSSTMCRTSASPISSKITVRGMYFSFSSGV